MERQVASGRDPCELVGNPLGGVLVVLLAVGASEALAADLPAHATLIIIGGSAALTRRWRLASASLRRTGSRFRATPRLTPSRAHRARPDRLDPTPAARLRAGPLRTQAPALPTPTRRWPPRLPWPPRDPSPPSQLALGRRPRRRVRAPNRAPRTLRLTPPAHLATTSKPRRPAPRVGCSDHDCPTPLKTNNTTPARPAEPPRPSQRHQPPQLHPGHPHHQLDARSGLVGASRRALKRLSRVAVLGANAASHP
jgi:hypothetical protein